jgi:hypothetical protein
VQGLKKIIFMYKYIITNGAQIRHEINSSKNITLYRLYKSYCRKIIQMYTFRIQNKSTIRKNELLAICENLWQEFYAFLEILIIFSFILFTDLLDIMEMYLL